MPREDTRKLILDKGARLIHSRGFVNTGIQEILDASSVPKGSFYFYFKSKEHFGQELVEHYLRFITAMIGRYLNDASRSPIERLRRFFDDSCKLYEGMRYSGGCPIGNLSQEMSDISEPMREKLNAAYSAMKSAFQSCLEEARDRGEIDMGIDAQSLATFILNGWEGALIDMKLSRSVTPLVIFKDLLLETMLKK